VAQHPRRTAIWRVLATLPKHVVQADASTSIIVGRRRPLLPPPRRSQTGLRSGAIRAFARLPNRYLEANLCLFVSDNVNGAGRTLTVGMAVTGGLTMEKCTSGCQNAGYSLAGGEYAGFVFVNPFVPYDVMLIIYSFTENAVCIYSHFDIVC
jgi:hypothetical protein